MKNMFQKHLISPKKCKLALVHALNSMGKKVILKCPDDFSKFAEFVIDRVIHVAI